MKNFIVSGVAAAVLSAVVAAVLAIVRRKSLETAEASVEANRNAGKH